MTTPAFNLLGMEKYSVQTINVELSVDSRIHFGTGSHSRHPLSPHNLLPIPTNYLYYNINYLSETPSNQIKMKSIVDSVTHVTFYNKLNIQNINEPWTLYLNYVKTRNTIASSA